MSEQPPQRVRSRELHLLKKKKNPKCQLCSEGGQGEHGVQTALVERFMWLIDQGWRVTTCRAATCHVRPKGASRGDRASGKM